MTGRRRAAVLLAMLLGCAWLVAGQFDQAASTAGSAGDLRMPVRYQELEPDRPDLIGEPGTEPPQTDL